MAKTVIPVSLLLAPELSASAKLIWMLVRLQPKRSPIDPPLLADRSGLCRKSVVNALSELRANGWDPKVEQKTPAATVHIPAELITAKDISTQATLLYGSLQLLPLTPEGRRQFTYDELVELTGISQPTLTRAVTVLVQSEWLEVERDNKRAPSRFMLRNPVTSGDAADAERAREKLDDIRFLGEAVMREYLSLLITSDDYQDNATPAFLVSPLTDAPLELDRYYSDKAGFEYNGPQHDHATNHYSEEVVARQRIRDVLKAGLCTQAGIPLVIVHAEDLTLQRMQANIPANLPRRELKGHEQLIKVLAQKGQVAIQSGRHHRRPE